MEGWKGKNAQKEQSLFVFVFFKELSELHCGLK